VPLRALLTCCNCITGSSSLHYAACTLLLLLLVPGSELLCPLHPVSTSQISPQHLLPLQLLLLLQLP
jgi:hypothetical protein